MSNLHRSFITFILHVVFTHLSRSQCASYFSYCLSGMHPSEQYAGICSNYDYVSIDEGCKYFKHTQNEYDFEIYIHWSQTYDRWIIGNNISDAEYYAYCFNDALDECTSGHWYFYSADIDQDVINYDLTIEPCIYDNTQCIATYIDSNNIGAYDFCVSHTFRRGFNRNIAGFYSISGCNEEQPYYNKNGYALAWDNELNAWFIGNSHNLPASDHYAFCTEIDIVDCDQKWYVWNGYASELDTNVVSGYCNTCTDVSYDNICVYFTESSSSMQFIEGTYAFDQCIQLKSGYTKVNHNTLTLHYVAHENAFVIDDNYNSFSLYAKCMNSTAITDCNTDASWFVRYQSSSEFTKESTMRIKVGSCQDLYETTESIVSTTDTTASATTTTQTTSVTKPRTSHTDTTSTAAHDEKATLATTPPIGIDSGLLIVIIICGAVIILAVLLLFGFFCYRHYHYKEVKTQKQQYSQVPTSTAATPGTTAPGQVTTEKEATEKHDEEGPAEEEPLYGHKTSYSQKEGVVTADI